MIPDAYAIPPESFVRGVPADITPLEETGVDAEAIVEEYPASTRL